MNLRKVKYQTIALVVTGAGLSAASANVTTDKNYERVTGIKAKTNDLANIASRAATFTKFEIASQEIYPAGFPIEDIIGSTDVNPNDRFDKDVDMEAAGQTVNVTVLDGSMAGQVYPYTVTITLKLTNPIQK